MPHHSLRKTLKGGISLSRVASHNLRQGVQTTSRDYVAFSFPKRRFQDRNRRQDTEQDTNEQPLTPAEESRRQQRKIAQVKALKKKLRKMAERHAVKKTRSDLKLLRNPFAIEDRDYELPPMPKRYEQTHYDSKTGMQLSPNESIKMKEDMLQNVLQRKKQEAAQTEKNFVPMTSIEQKWYKLYVARVISSEEHLDLLNNEQKLRQKDIDLQLTKNAELGVRTANPDIISTLPKDPQRLKKLQEDFQYVSTNLSYLPKQLRDSVIQYNPKHPDNAPASDEDSVILARVLDRYTEDVHNAFNNVKLSPEQMEEIDSYYESRRLEITKDALLSSQKENFQYLMKDLIMWRAERRKLFVRAIIRQADDVELANRIKTCFMNWKLWKNYVRQHMDKGDAIRKKYEKLNEVTWKKGLEGKAKWQFAHENEFRELLNQWKMIQYNEDMTGKDIMNKVEEEDDNDPFRYELFSKYFYDGDHGWVEKRLFSEKEVDTPPIENIDPLKYQQNRYELSKQYGVENAPFLQQQRQLSQLARGDAPFGSDSVSGTFKPPVADPDLPPVDLPEDHEPISASQDKVETLNRFLSQTPFKQLGNDTLLKHQYDFPFEETRITWKRVSVQRAQGKEVHYNCHLLIGSEKGFVGVGFGRSPDPHKCVTKARRAAYANLRSFDVDTKNPRTVVSSRVRSKNRSSIILITPSRFEYVAAHPILQKICRYLGITHCSIKLHGSRHMYAVIPNFFKALEMLKTEEFARAGRGKTGPQKSERHFSNYLEKAHDRSVYGNSHMNSLQ